MYHEMVKHISVDTAVLTETSTAAAEIDRCLNSMLYHSRPVYIGVPVDISHRLISGDGLKTPLKRELSPNDQETEIKVVDRIVQKLDQSKFPVIIADGNAIRNGCVADADKLAEITGFPYFTTCMGKGGPNEDLPNFGGVYGGGGSIPEIRKALEEKTDCVLWLGSFRVRSTLWER
jgi:pyruvate decarboxylase